jgi:phthalate 4,5-dioxygenase oxygenase subunit
MLSRQDNELLTRTGAGTPMGDLMRRYWIPALLAWELPHPDSDPLRIRLLGEDLVAFRDSNGQVGALANNCPHRGASLFFGRNEEAGIRCVYHGWKFDVSGACVDMPNEPAESDFRSKVRATAYPCVERGGIIWVYMGPPAFRPQLPDLEWALVDAEQRYLSKRIQETNYAQAMEGGIDSSHVSFLHKDGAGQQNGDVSLAGRYLNSDGAPKFEVVDTPYGFVIGARRNAEADSHYWRITQWLFPFFQMIPPFGDAPVSGHAWVPIDDEHCYTFSMTWHPQRALTESERAWVVDGHGVHALKTPGTFRPIRNRSNDYLIDREAQRTGRSYTGISGISEQDTAVQESMGSIYDRTSEHLGTSDAAIIQMRRRLLRAANELAKGIEPPALEPEVFRVRSVSLVLPRNVASWPEAAREAMTAERNRFFVSLA